MTDYDYDGRHGAVNFFDTAIVETTQPISALFGKEERAMHGIWTSDLKSGDRIYFYGASSGFQGVRISSFGDTFATMLTSLGQRLLYKDMISFVNDRDDGKPASIDGDSGGALLVNHRNGFWVAGLLVGGGGRIVPTRRPISYAVPITRIMSRFNISSSI